MFLPLILSDLVYSLEGVVIGFIGYCFLIEAFVIEIGVLKEHIFFHFFCPQFADFGRD